MKGLWGRLKRFYNGQDRIDRMNREFEQRIEWHREDIERARKQARVELRDRFAMAALTGLLAANYEFTDRVVEETWEIADAMLKARGDV
ncbi:MAG: hypothetical protein INF71_18790 [Roseomonas sp.]|nr:hypothetical protein [Roseomonas sp.]